MDKKTIVILGAILLVAAIFGVSQFFPLPSGSDTEGTIGKVNKYRQSSISEEDVRLRNELLNNPEAMKATVETLEFYHNYLAAFSSEVAECQQEMAGLEAGSNTLAREIQGLNDLNSFLDNNLETVAATQRMLADYQNGAKSGNPGDIDNHLIQFGDFATNLTEKDKALDAAFKALDQSIDREALSDAAEIDAETQKLVNVRERMLGMLCLHSNALGNEERLQTLWGTEVLNMLAFNDSLNVFFGKITGSKVGLKHSKVEAVSLNLLLSQEAMNFLASNEQLGVFGSGTPLGSVLDADKLGLHFMRDAQGHRAGPFFKDQLGVLAFGKEQLQFFGKANLGATAAFAERLNMSW